MSMVIHVLILLLDLLAWSTLYPFYYLLFWNIAKV